jgi:hypothetical protein
MIPTPKKKKNTAIFPLTVYCYKYHKLLPHTFWNKARTLPFSSIICPHALAVATTPPVA